MNKIERVTSALRGEDVDRPPFGFWYHFGLQHMGGRKHAEAETDFYRAYDMDFLKVMSDYPYPLPGGLDVLETEEDWKRVEPLTGGHESWKKQLEALSIISDDIGKEALFIETIFSPWTTARRLTRSGRLDEARLRHPEALLAAMDSIAMSLAAYARSAVEHGAAGIFLSLGAATDDVMSVEEYKTWGRPFDLKVLNAVREAPFNVLHIHGKRNHFDALIEYPTAAVNWSHFATSPSLKEGSARSGKAVLGGINEATVAHLSPTEIEDQIRLALTDVGTRGVIVAPGCSVPTDTPVRSLQSVGIAVEKWRQIGRLPITY